LIQINTNYDLEEENSFVSKEFILCIDLSENVKGQTVSLKKRKTLKSTRKTLKLLSANIFLMINRVFAVKNFSKFLTTIVCFW